MMLYRNFRIELRETVLPVHVGGLLAGGGGGGGGGPKGMLAPSQIIGGPGPPPPPPPSSTPMFLNLTHYSILSVPGKLSDGQVKSTSPSSPLTMYWLLFIINPVGKR